MHTESRVDPSPRLGSGAMFDRIARRYDTLNRLMSLGIDGRWRARAVDALALGAGARVLDVATGTGDVALAVARAYPDATIVGVDPATEMLKIAQTKTAALGLADRVSFREGSAEALPCPAGWADGVIIAFGIRNVEDRAAGLVEMARVCKPGGRVVILELTEPNHGLLERAARFHLGVVVPALGSLLSDGEAYRYLRRSIQAFPPAPEFAKAIEGAGLRILQVEPMTFGACTLFVAEVAEEEGRA